MTPEERAEKERQLRALKSNMFTPVEEVADFKVIKNIEVFLTTLTAEQKALLPHDPDELHTTREATREEIRKLQEELDNDTDNTDGVAADADTAE